MYSRSPYAFHWVTFAILVAILGAIWIPGLVGPTGLRPWQVTGRVTYNGVPLANGTIVLMPLEQRNNDWAASALDLKGRFALGMQGGRSEMTPGRYAIFFVFQGAGTSSQGRRDPSKDDEGTAEELARHEPAPPPIPVRYTKPETSGLWVRLVEGANQIAIDLKD